MKYDYEDQFVDALKSITDNNLKKKLVAIKKLVCERMAIEREFKKEHNVLEFKYEKDYKAFYDRRQRIIEGEEKPVIDEIKDKLNELSIPVEDANPEKETEKGVPEFWYSCIETCQDIMMSEKDREILKKIKAITCEQEESGNFKLHFTFYPNDYFTNETITREFILDEDFDIKEMKSDEINWKSDEVNPTIEIKTKKVKNKRTKQIKTITKRKKIPSFFSSFRNMVKKEGDKNKKNEDKDSEEGSEEPEMSIEEEFDVALQFKEEIIPYAIEYYLGIADDEIEEGEEEFDEEEEEEEEKPKGRKGGKGGKRH